MYPGTHTHKLTGMPSWECACRAVLQSPTATEALARLRELGVCTGTQCLDSAAAAYGLAPAAAPAAMPAAAFVAVALLALGALLLAPGGDAGGKRA